MKIPKLPEGFPTLHQPENPHEEEPYIDIRELHEWLGVSTLFPQWWSKCRKYLKLKEGVDYTETKDKYGKQTVHAPLYITWMLVFCCKSIRQKIDTVAYLLDCDAMLREILSEGTPKKGGASKNE
nr:MAG TPA: AntA/AntB antirepressor [Caudoviricetes sp.]